MIESRESGDPSGFEEKRNIGLDSRLRGNELNI
jgi:hypothetical protein